MDIHLIIASYLQPTGVNTYINLPLITKPKKKETQICN